jgi:ligand-binding sensor domain-containing protein
VGTVTLRASQAATPSYPAATTTISFNVSAEIPILAFNPIPNQIYGAAPFTVSASSNSSGAITYSVVSGPATLSGNRVTLTGAGTITLRASQAAAGGYAAATATTNLISTRGSVWIGNSNKSLSTLDFSGDPISGSSGVAGGGLGSIAGPLGLAIDSSGDVWVANNDGVSKFSQQGVPMTSAAYTSGGITNPVAVAVDGAGQMWAANSNGTVSVLSNTGTAVSPSTGYSGTGSKPAGIAIDITGSVWIPSSTGNKVTKILGATAPVVTLASGSATELGVRP